MSASSVARVRTCGPGEASARASSKARARSPGPLQTPRAPAHRSISRECVPFSTASSTDPPRRAARASKGVSPTSAVADDDRIGEAPLLRDALLRLASFALLDAAPHRLAPGPDAAAVGVPSARSVRLALEYIERHAERDLSVTEIAGAANLSVRGLQSAFRRHDLVSPMRQVRETRLRRARDELRSTPPGGATVAAVAARWGFANTGRFTAAYRERFDTTPGRDLASG